MVICVLYYYRYSFMESTLPEIHKYNVNNGKNTFICAGIHGDEFAPAVAINNLVRSGDIKSVINNKSCTIVPFVNKDAIKSNSRSTFFQPDINRCYPDKHNINKLLLKYVNSADTVIDFHEARGYNRCKHLNNFGQFSHGQTMYTNSQYLVPKLQLIIDKLNSNFGYVGCKKWQLLEKIDIPDGSLADYCTKQGIPFILVEMTGHEKVDVKERMNVTKFIMTEYFTDS